MNNKVLNDDGCLSEKFMNQYNYIEAKQDFEFIVETLAMNKMVHCMYNQLLDYKINDDLEFVVYCDDPRTNKTDTRVLLLDRSYYDNNIEVCTELLYLFKEAWSHLNSMERYIIKSLYFDDEKKTDEELIDEIFTYKNKYMLYKKSAYIKMNCLLKTNDPYLKGELDEFYINALKVISVLELHEGKKKLEDYLVTTSTTG